jgi:hypothetical protein
MILLALEQLKSSEPQTMSIHDDLKKKEILLTEFGRDDRQSQTEQNIRNQDGKSTIWCVNSKSSI